MSSLEGPTLKKKIQIWIKYLTYKRDFVILKQLLTINQGVHITNFIIYRPVVGKHWYIVKKKPCFYLSEMLSVQNIQNNCSERADRIHPIGPFKNRQFIIKILNIYTMLSCTQL